MVTDYSGWIGLRSLPVTSADGYLFAKILLVLKCIVWYINTKFNGPDPCSSANIKYVMRLFDRGNI